MAPLPSFIHQVIEDIPLIVSLPKKSRRRVHLVRAKAHFPCAVLFEAGAETSNIPWEKTCGRMVTWRIHDKNGKLGDLRIYNTFAL